MYLASGVAKIRGGWVTDPNVIWSHLHDSYQTALTHFMARTVPALGWTIFQYVTLLYEVGAPVSYALPETRLPALYIGLQAVRAINSSDDRLCGRRLAIAGTVLGIGPTVNGGPGPNNLLVLSDSNGESPSAPPDTPAQYLYFNNLAIVPSVPEPSSLLCLSVGVIALLRGRPR